MINTLDSYVYISHEVKMLRVDLILFFSLIRLKAASTSENLEDWDVEVKSLWSLMHQ